MRMLKVTLIFVALALGLNACAGIMEFRLPKEFDGKKTVQDPPVVQAFSDRKTV